MPANFDNASDLTEIRVEFVMDLMRNFKFRTGKTGKELSAEWGICLDRVKDICAEASKRIRAEVTDPDRVRLKVSAALDKVLEDSLADGDRRSVINAAKAWAVISGANAPQRIDIGGPGLTPQSAGAAVREAFGGKVKPHPDSESDVPATRDDLSSHSDE